ncbi:hypothetical protein CC2G_013471 [Coprinopsis cinerea AmutBmut pab1-1]|nr:hypothetical protein CC2G_013471 [Coprinopsis cinerea AmutBmut pab1-1]
MCVRPLPPGCAYIDPAWPLTTTPTNYRSRARPEASSIGLNVELLDLVHAADAGELKIVPGPGLPSLESLNLTSRDLVVRAFERMERQRKLELEAEEDTSNLKDSQLEKRYTPTCSSTGSLSPYYAWFCFEYLHAIGGTTCAVPSAESRFCHSASNTGSDVAWWGWVNGVSYTQSSWCVSSLPPSIHPGLSTPNW